MIRFPWRRAAASAVVLAAAAASLTACSFGPDHTLHVLAGSEVEDMQPILEDMVRETGVHLEFEYMGTLDGTEALVNSGADRPWDATWFPSNRYLTLFPAGKDAVAESTSIMRSPVVLGVKPAVADRLGWSGDDAPTWQEVVDAVERGELEYGMTSPVASNSGFTTLVQAATALAGTGTVLTADDIDETTEALSTFASGQSLASGSSGWLAERFVEDPTAVDAIFNYESVLQGLTIDGAPLSIVIPSDGIITSDYPLTLLDSADEADAEAYAEVVAYLQQADVQQRIADVTHRRTDATAPSDAVTAFELPFPAQLQTVQELLQTWVATARKPASMVFAIDTSGSMSTGTRMDDLREALQVLSGSADSGSAGFLKLQPREDIAFFEFAGAEKSMFTAEIPADDAGYARAMDEINRRIAGYEPAGGTAIYDIAERTLEYAADNTDDDRISSVVLFTDGENTGGDSLDDFRRWYEEFRAGTPEADGIPIHVVIFGEADPDEMEQLAAITGGRAFEAADSSLASVFREIRGYL